MGAAMMALLEGKPLSLLSPNGGEQIGKGSTVTIQWFANNDIPNVKLDYSLDAGATWVPITASVPASDGTFSWTVPDAEHPLVIVRVSALDGSTSDQSNTSFGLITEVVQMFTGSLTFQIMGGNSYSLHPSVSRIEIFNTRGRMVRTFYVNGPVVTWKGRDDGGNILETGIYLARLISGARLKPLKLIWQK